MAGAKASGKTKKKIAAKPAKRPARTAKAVAPTKRATAKRATAKRAPSKRAPPARSKPRTAAPVTRSEARVRTAATQQAQGAIDKLQQVALTATNLDASIAFYRDTLGLRFIARFDPPGLAFFNMGGIRLLLSATASEATLYFAVSDLKAAYRDFQKRGVHFLQPPAMIHRDEAGEFGKKGVEEWMAFFRDPAGNTLALVERR